MVLFVKKNQFFFSGACGRRGGAHHALRCLAVGLGLPTSTLRAVYNILMKYFVALKLLSPA